MKDSKNKSIKFKDIGAMVSLIFGLIGACFAGYFYLIENFVSTDKYVGHNALIKVKFIEIDLSETNHELDHLLKIPEAELTVSDKHHIKMLTKKSAFLEEHLPWE